MLKSSVGAVVSDFDIRISDFSIFGTPKVELFNPVFRPFYQALDIFPMLPEDKNHDNKA